MVEGSEQGDAASSGNSRVHNTTPDTLRGLSGATLTCARLCAPPSEGKREEFPTAAFSGCLWPTLLCAIGSLRGGWGRLSPRSCVKRPPAWAWLCSLWLCDHLL